jgi:hypothetical protein
MNVTKVIAFLGLLILPSASVAQQSTQPQTLAEQCSKLAESVGALVVNPWVDVAGKQFILDSYRNKCMPQQQPVPQQQFAPQQPGK